MDNLQEIQNEIFLDIKKNLESLSQIETKDELISNIQQITRVYDKALFLKVFDQIDFSGFRFKDVDRQISFKKEVSNTENSYHVERKFKMTHIKSLKHDGEISELPIDLSKTIKIDLNDKIAFLKFLFNNDATCFSEVINKLNQFTNHTEANNFLSEVYHKNNWEQVDEYAQRLWGLVENKFR